jgi:O-antigen/teichoic acid export membrane protein
MVRRSFVFAFIDKSAGALLAIITMAVTSRLLTPAEVGLFMVASSMILLIEAFRDFGVGPFLIQEAELTPEITRSAVTVIVVMSLGLGLVVYFSADVLAGIFSNSELAGLIRVAALAFLVAPIATPLLALLRRDMNFGAVARISIFAAAVNAATAISMAALGFGAYSLVWGSVFAACANMVGALICLPKWWIFRPSFQYWRQVLPFGVWSTIITILGMLYDSMPRLILGRFLGFSAVGIFSRSVSLTQLPDRVFLSAVQPVILPAFSARSRAGEGIVEPYLLGISFVTALQWPALLCLAVLADPLVRLLLGPQWLEVVPLLRIIALASFALFPIYFSYPVLVTVGRVREMAFISLITLPVSTLVVLVAAQSSLFTVAWSLFFANAFQMIVMLFVVRRHVPFTWRVLGTVLGTSLLVTAGAGAVPVLSIAFLGADLNVWATLFSVLGAAVGWGAVLYLTGHPISSEISRVIQRIPWLQSRLGSKST